MTLLFPSKSFRRPRERSSGLLWAFGVDDLSLGLVTGQSITIDRNSEATTYDVLGRVATIVQDQPAWSMSFNAEAGIWEPGLAIGSNRTNVCLQSEDFGAAAWTASNSPTRTAAAWRIGDVVLDLLGDNSGATQALYSQNLSFTGDAKKGFSIYVKRGKTPPVGGSRIKIRDTTASADRLNVLITFSGSSTVPTVTMTTGILLETFALADGVYLLRMQSTTITTANTNALQVMMADVTAQTGDIYLGGVLASNKAYPEQYRKTTTATVTTQGDAVTSTLDAAPQDCTIYVRFSKPLWAYDLTTAPAAGVIMLGDQTTNGKGFAVQYAAAGANISVQLQDNDGTVAVASVALPAASQWDVCVQLRDLTTAPAARIDAGAGFSSWTATAMDGFTAWSNNVISLGGAGSPSPGVPSLDANIRRALIKPGHHDLAKMRGILV